MKKAFKYVNRKLALFRAVVKFIYIYTHTHIHTHIQIEEQQSLPTVNSLSYIRQHLSLGVMLRVYS